MLLSGWQDFFLPTVRRARQRWGQQKGLIAQVAAEQRVALTPQLEAPRDGIEHPGFVQGALVTGRLSEKAGAQLGIPANVVPRTHLVREESVSSRHSAPAVSIIRQTRVVEQLLSIDRRLGDVLQAHHEKLQ